jgi:hypothetical protein
MIVRAEIELPIKELNFVRALSEGWPASRAAEIAGYAACHAVYLLRKPRVIAALRAIYEGAKAHLEAIEHRKPYKGERPAAPPDEDEAA